MDGPIESLVNRHPVVGWPAAIRYLDAVGIYGYNLDRKDRRRRVAGIVDSH